MKNVLILGIGGSGAAVAETHFANRNREQGFSYLAMDTDLQALERLEGIPTLPLTDPVSLGQTLDRLDLQAVSDYFPCDDPQGQTQYYSTLEMGRGANGWRMKGLLSFDDMLSDHEKREMFTHVLDGLVDETDPGRPIEIVLAASLAGGTGSALFLPVAMYIRKYFAEKYGRDITIKALLSCPDVYAGSLTAENKIKAYANAYAALAELNAVDLVSKGYNVAAEAESRLRIRFRIGSRRSGGIGLLFDSEDPAFCVRSTQPFARVYLFDRIPGTTTVAAHEQVMAKLLGVIVGDNTALSEGGEVYAAVSFAEVQFAHECIPDYVAKQTVFEELEKTWLPFYRSVYVEKEYGRSATYCFAKGVTDAYRAHYASEEYDRNSEKEEDIFPGEPKDFEEDCKHYIKELKKTLFSMLDSVPEDIAQAVATIKGELRPSRASGFSRKKRANAVRNQAQYYCKLLCDYLEARSAEYRKVKTGLKDLLLDEDNKISLMSNVFVHKGEYLHPVTALLYLCELYCAIQDSFKVKGLPCKEFEEPHIEPMTLPEFLFEAVKLGKNVNRRYAALGQERLAKVAFDAPEKLLYRLADDLSDLKDDFLEFYSEIEISFTDLLMADVGEVIAELIEKYKHVFDSVSGILSDHRVDVKLALAANTESNCTLMNVGCSEENKRKAYAYYRGEKKKGIPDRFGRIVFNHPDAHIRETLFEELEEKEKQVVLQTVTITRACGRNIFRVLHDRDIFGADVPERNSDHDFVRAMSLVALPLDLSIPETPRDEITEKTVSLVPEEAAAFARDWLNAPGLSLQEAADKYSYYMGSYDSEIKVSSAVPKNAIFSTKSVSGFPLYFFNKVNEETHGYYGFYKKALGVMRKQGTQMWNPHLVKESAMGFLPFIDPARRNAFESNVYKAVLYLLQYGRLSVEDDGEEENVFFYEWNGTRVKAMYNGKPVKAKNPELLFAFMRGNTELTEQFGQAFDAEIKRQIALLPPIGFVESDMLKFEREIFEGKFATFLNNDLFAYVCAEPPVKAKNFVDFLYDLTEKKTSEEATNLAKTVVAVFRTMIYSRHLDAEDLYCTIFGRIMQSLKSEYEQNAKRAGRRLYRDKADRVFSLLDEAWASSSAHRGQADSEDTLC